MAVDIEELLTAKQAGEMMALPHKEIIRRIRKNDLKASKLGWVYVLRRRDVKKAMEAEWYQRVSKS
jgi:hypothetical protein